VQILQIRCNIGDNPCTFTQKFIDEQIADYIQKRIKDNNVVQLDINDNNSTNNNIPEPMAATLLLMCLLIKIYLHFDRGIESLSKTSAKIL